MDTSTISTMTPVTTSSLFRPFNPFPTSPTTPSQPSFSTLTTSSSSSTSSTGEATKPQLNHTPQPTSKLPPISPINTPQEQSSSESSSPSESAALFRPFNPPSPSLASKSNSPIPSPPPIPTIRPQDRQDRQPSTLSTLSKPQGEGWIGNSRRYRSDGDLKTIALAARTQPGLTQWKPVRFRRIVEKKEEEREEKIQKPVAMKGVTRMQNNDRAMTMTGGLNGIRRNWWASKTEYPLSTRLATVKPARRCQSVDFDGRFELMAEKGCGGSGIVVGERIESDLSRNESEDIGMSVGSSFGTGSRMQSMESTADIMPGSAKSSETFSSTSGKRAVSSLTPAKSRYLQEMLAVQDILGSDSASSDEGTIYDFDNNPIASSMRDFDYKHSPVRGAASSSYSVLNHLPRRTRIFRSFRPLRANSTSPKEAPKCEKKQARKSGNERRLLKFLRQSFHRQSRKV